MPKRKTQPRSTDWHTVADAAAAASKTEGAIRAAIRRGELTVHNTKGGKGKLLLVADVEKWAADTTRRPGPKRKS